MLNKLKMAWQRATRGYDDEAVYNFDMWFLKTSEKILTDMSHCDYLGLWQAQDGDTEIQSMAETPDVNWLTQQATQKKLLELIYCLHMSQWENIEAEKSYLTDIQIKQERDKYWSKAAKILSEHLFELWI